MKKSLIIGLLAINLSCMASTVPKQKGVIKQAQKNSTLIIDGASAAFTGLISLGAASIITCWLVEGSFSHIPQIRKETSAKTLMGSLVITILAGNACVRLMQRVKETMDEG